MAAVWACGGQPPPQATHGSSPTTSASSTAAVSAADPPRQPPSPAEGALATVPRQVIDQILRAGPGKFLQNFELEATRDGRTFVGWRIVALRGPRERWQGIDLHEGDVVTSVNGFSLERDTDYYRAFQSLSVVSEVRVRLLREGQSAELRWTITDP